MNKLLGFGAALKTLRKRRGGTLASLAAEVQVDASDLSRYEREQIWPSREVLERLLDGLGVSFVDLAQETERQGRIAAGGGVPIEPSPAVDLESRMREIAREELGARLAGLAGIPLPEFEQYVRFIRAAGGEPDLEGIAILRRILGGTGG